MGVPSRFWKGHTAPIAIAEASDRDRRLAEAFLDMEPRLSDLKTLTRTLERFSDLTIEQEREGVAPDPGDLEILVTLIISVRSMSARLMDEWTQDHQSAPAE